MKRIHLAILISSIILTIVSGYTIEAINLIYDIPVEWYSKASNTFKVESRNTSFYNIISDNKNISPKFEVINGYANDGLGIRRIKTITNPDFNKYIYMYCTLGEMTGIDSNIKIKEMAQRGNTVEVVCAINVTTLDNNGNLFYPEDFGRIDKKMLINKGKLVFVFKNQFGGRIGESEIDISNKQ